MEHKVYLQNKDIKELLWEKHISEYPNINWDSNNIDTFCWRLGSALTYLKKDDTKKFLHLYEKIFNKTTNDVDYAYDKIINLIERNKKDNNSQWLYELYDFILETGIDSRKITEINTTGSLFSLLTNFSKLKLLLYLLKKEMPQNQWESKNDYMNRLKNKINEIAKLYIKDDDIINDLYSIWLSDLYYQIAMYFGEDYEDTIKSLSLNPEIDSSDIQLIVSLLEESNVDQSVLEGLQKHYTFLKTNKVPLTSQNDTKINWEEYLEWVVEVERKGVSDFNPYIISLNFETWINILWYNRLIEIYKKTFSDITNSILSEFNWTRPSFSKLLKFDVNQLKWNKESKEKKFVHQYIIEFDVDEKFDMWQLREIAILLNEELWDINLQSPIVNEKLKHPLITMEWILTYDGYFSDSWEKFADSNVILIKWEKGQKLRLTLSYFNQDIFVYLISQVWTFISNWKFKKKSQLYFDIYNRYNKTFFNDTLYDISILKENYKKFFKNIILPFTKEGLERWIKASDIILAWVYWTWKSQFLKHLLLNKEWEVNWEKFFLSANVISFGLQEFKSLLATWTWWIRTRLDEIYQNTKAPIILIVEDIDTLINEKMHWVNDEIAQALTILFEWVGSLPINFITTSNDPTKFSERLIRPWRLEEIIIFNRPTEKEKKQMLIEHLKKANLELSENILNIIYKSKIITDWTSSHIWKLVKDISNHIKIKELFDNNNNHITEEEIVEIINNIAIPIWDIESTESKINNWHKNVKWKKFKKEEQRKYIL